VSAFTGIRIQLRQRDEITDRRSGLTTRSALEDLKSHSLELFEHFVLNIIQRAQGAVSFKLAAEISQKMSTELMSKIYEQINPDSIGQDARDLSIAKQYCDRLSSKSGNLRTGSVERLVHGYPSHDFVIDLEEAREIFVNIEMPTQSLNGLLMKHAHKMIVPRTSTPVVEFIDEAVSSELESVNSDAEKTNDRDGDDGAVAQSAGNERRTSEAP
jgi:hypothetical protein